MQIRNNWGEVIGEINSGFTDKGERIITNTLYDRGNRSCKTSVSATIKETSAQRM
jgi:hypothetical protein